MVALAAGGSNIPLLARQALDTGAESVLARRPEALALIADLGLETERVHPTAAKPQLLVAGRLHAMPPSLQGVPVAVEVPAPRVYRAARPVRSWDDTSAAERDWASGQANTGTHPDGLLTKPSYPEAPPEQRTPRREMSPAMRRQLAVEELEELEEAPPGGPLSAIGFTVFWYAVPLVVYAIFTLANGAAERGRAVASLIDASPQFGISLALSIAIAYVLRLVSGTWKSASVGLASAVMGGGLAIVLVSAISGQPIG